MTSLDPKVFGLNREYRPHVRKVERSHQASFTLFHLATVLGRNDLDARPRRKLENPILLRIGLGAQFAHSVLGDDLRYAEPTSNHLVQLLPRHLSRSPLVSARFQHP